ncbi:MAG TPA: hypothetical protein VF254_07290 [Gammaproteobacteria bacterium]
MKDLFFSELRRFRWLALVAFTANFLLLLFLHRVSNLLQQSWLDALPMLFIYLAAGLALAIAQVGSYRKPSQWAWLIHRPLSPARIFAALALSSLALLAFVIFLPMLLLLLGTDFLTARVVDLRHYLLIVHVLAFALMAWMAGAHACVSRSRMAIVVFFAPQLLALHLVSTIELLLPVLLALGWLTYITGRSFRANREAPIRGTATLLVTALPLQLGLFLLSVVLWRFLFVSGSILLGVDPLNTDYPPEGGLIATERAEPSEGIALGLASSEDSRAASWRAQLPLLEPLRIAPALQRFPVRQQFSNLYLPTGWYDEERNVSWTFSHDRMLFIGRNPESGVAKGVFGLGGAGDVMPFDAVPIVTENNDLLTPHALYGIDEEAQTIELRLELHDNEQFTAMPQREFGRLLLLTNQRLIALREDQRAAATIKPLVSDWELALPEGPQHLDFASLAELMDGWLVSFVYGDGIRQIGFSQFNVVTPPWQQVLFVDADGKAAVVAERRINDDRPAMYRTDWWLSPPLDIFTTLPEAVLDKGLTWPMQLSLLPRVPVLYIAGALMLILSTGTACWWLRGTRVTPARRRVWLVSCALLGLPALLSLLLLEPRE